MNKKEADSVYFLKIILFLILGLMWVYFPSSKPLGLISGIPIGLFIGLLFASHEHFQIDRKIEFAILLVSTVIGYLFPLISLQLVY